MRVLDCKVYKGWYVWAILPAEVSVKPEVVSRSGVGAHLEEGPGSRMELTDAEIK